ncbi:MAG: endonuclease NucS [Ignisphaera sp.]
MTMCISIDLETPCPNIIAKLNELKNKYVIIIVGEMIIEYIGRATSYAQMGSRLLITKPDGSLLVHDATKVEPLNWQPPKSYIQYECRDNRIFVKSSRKNPQEEVLIEINRAYLITTCQLTSAKPVIIGKESDIVRMILSNISIINSNARILGTDVATTYGKIDVLLKKEDGTLIVVEVKNEKAGVSAVLQLKRYVDFYKDKGLKVEGVLVAPSITTDAFTLLHKEGMQFIDLRKLLQEFNVGSIEKLDKYIKSEREHYK